MSTNDITGDKIATKEVSETYRNNYGSIDWSKKAGAAPAASTIKTCMKCPRDTDSVRLRSGAATT
jgi:hypothetical protein